MMRIGTNDLIHKDIVGFNKYGNFSMFNRFLNIVFILASYLDRILGIVKFQGSCNKLVHDCNSLAEIIKRIQRITLKISRTVD